MKMKIIVPKNISKYQKGLEKEIVVRKNRALDVKKKKKSVNLLKPHYVGT